MIVSRFEALGLLPDGEEFTAFRIYSAKGDARRFHLDLESLARYLTSDTYVVCRYAQRRRGVVVETGRLQIQVDSKKARKFVKRFGGKIPVYDFAERPWMIACPSCNRRIGISRSIQIGEEFPCPKCRAVLLKTDKRATGIASGPPFAGGKRG